MGKCPTASDYGGYVKQSPYRITVPRSGHWYVMITVQLDIQKNRYFAEFSNLGLQKVPIEDE